jgi:hypothetical protein
MAAGLAAIAAILLTGGFGLLLVSRGLYGVTAYPVASRKPAPVVSGR